MATSGLLAAIRFLILWGPTALTLIEEISKLMKRMVKDDDRNDINAQLADIIAHNYVERSRRIRALNELLCQAEECQSR